MSELLIAAIDVVVEFEPVTAVPLTTVSDFGSTLSAIFNEPVDRLNVPLPSATLFLLLQL
jgi:predicted nucleotidyltransferase